MGYDEVSEDVLRHSQPLKLEVVPTEKEYSELQSFKYHADPGQRVYVRVSRRASNPSAATSWASQHDRIFTVPDYPKLLRFMADGSLLSLSGDKRISVVSRNMPGMKLEIGRVLPDQLQHLVSLNDGTYSHPQLTGRSARTHRRTLRARTRRLPARRAGRGPL